MTRATCLRVEMRFMTARPLSLKYGLVTAGATSWSWITMMYRFMCEESQRVLVILIKNKNSKSKSGQSAVQKLIASPVHEMPRLTTFIVIFVHLTLRLAREIRRGNRLRSKIKRALSTNKTKSE